MSAEQFKPKANLRIAKPYPPKITNLSGKQMNRLYVFGYAGRSPDHANYWLCRCDCGNWITAEHSKLSKRNLQSCGCFRSDYVAAKNTTHGLRRDSLYTLWLGMINRCHNPAPEKYPHHAGKGIYVCERWRDFVLFKSDVGERPSPKHSLDRKDGNGPYCPENVRWATQTEQMRNTSRNRWIEFNGRRHTMPEWAEITGISYYVLRSRMHAGWPIDEALGFVPKKDRRTGVKLGPNKKVLPAP